MNNHPRYSLKNITDKKNKNAFVQFIKYFFTGGIAAVIDIGSFLLFSISLHIDYRISIVLSFTLGTLTNFFICNAFVFERKSLSLFAAAYRHYLSSLGGLVTNEIVMMLLIELLNFSNLLIAKLIATAAAFMVNFLLIKFYAFNSKVKILQN
jgi:putative flippase GtrA